MTRLNNTEIIEKFKRDTTRQANENGYVYPSIVVEMIQFMKLLNNESKEVGS